MLFRSVYFDAKQPWKSRKDNMADCGTTINVCIQTQRTLATLMAPFLPFSADKCKQMLNLGDDYTRWAGAAEELPGGHELGQAAILFQKLETEEVAGD